MENVCMDVTLTFVHDLLPQRLDQHGIRVSREVNDGQFALR